MAIEKQAYCEVGKERSKSACTIRPKVDIWETQDAFNLEAEVPGVDKQNLDVKLEDGVLTIIGRVNVGGPEGTKTVHSEYRERNYERTFEVSNDIEGDKINAELRNGILCVILPKRETAKPKQIAINLT